MSDPTRNTYVRCSSNHALDDAAHYETRLDPMSAGLPSDCIAAPKVITDNQEVYMGIIVPVSFAAMLLLGLLYFFLQWFSNLGKLSAASSLESSTAVSRRSSAEVSIAIV